MIVLFVIDGDKGVLDEEVINDKQKHVKNIELCRRRLEEKLMEPRFGLVEELVSRKVLGRVQGEKVSKKKTPYEMNKLILKYVLKSRPMEVEQFTAALTSCDQQHVVNYVTGNAGKTICRFVPFQL